MSIDAPQVFYLEREPPTGAFHRLVLRGNFGHAIATPSRGPLRFVLDTGASRLIVRPRMLDEADGDAVEYAETDCPEVCDGALIPKRHVNDCLVSILGSRWSYRTAAVKFVLYERPDYAGDFACFTAQNARVLDALVVDGERLTDGGFHVRKTRQPKIHEDIADAIVGCDPVFQQCALVSHVAPDGGDPSAILTTDPDTVREVLSQLLRP